MELRAGARVNRYTLVKPLGEGGQGAVWKVIDPLDGGAVRALKLIVVRDLDVAAAERARREARALRRAGHPALVPCRELFEDPAEGLVGLVFDYQRGRSLTEAARDPRMSREHRLAVLEQLADALAHVHALGVVHRDLKPGNVLITDAFWSAPRTPGGVKLLDFGISAPAGNPQPLTATGAMVGTGPYLPPELLAPEVWPPARESFARDLFAFGVLAWDLLLGAHPTGLPPSATLEDRAWVYREAWEGRRPWPPPGVGGAWGAAIGACLALDPRLRPPTGSALLEILRGHTAAGQGARLSAPELAAATAAHVAPPRSGRPVAATTGMPASQPGPWAEPRTTPMPAPPVRPSQPEVTVPMVVSPRSVSSPSPGPPVPDPPGPAAASGSARRRWGWSAMGLLLGGAMGLGAWAALTRPDTLSAWLGLLPPPPASSARAGLSVPPLPMSVASSGPAAAASASASPTPDAGPPEPPSSKLCCAQSKDCSSGRKCSARTQCTAGLPEQPWLLRIVGAEAAIGNVRQEDLADKHPRARVCLRRAKTGEPEVCSPLVDVAKKGGDRTHRLEVTTEDLVHGAIEVSVKEGSTILYKGKLAATGKLQRSVLCIGLILKVGRPKDHPDHRQARISFHLDDP